MDVNEKGIPISTLKVSALYLNSFPVDELQTASVMRVVMWIICWTKKGISTPRPWYLAGPYTTAWAMFQTIPAAFRVARIAGEIIFFHSSSVN